MNQPAEPKPRAEKRTYADRAEYNRAYQRDYRRRQPRPATLMERVTALETLVAGLQDWIAMQRNLDADIAARSPVGRKPLHDAPPETARK